MLRVKQINSAVYADNSNMKTDSQVKVRSSSKLKVLIADSDRMMARRTADFLLQNGFEPRVVHTGSDVKVALVNWAPDIVLIDLILPNGNALELLNYHQSNPNLKQRKTVFIVISGHNNNAENSAEAFKRGAKDYLKKPFMLTDLLNRIILHCRSHEHDVKADDLSAKSLKESWDLVEQVLNLALQTSGTIEKTLYELTKTVEKKTNSVRCSFVRAVTQSQGSVLASSDDEKISGLPLDLTKYPEVQVVLNTGKMVAIENIENSRALKKIKTEIKSINFNSMIVCPIYYQGKIFGVLSVRMKDTKVRIRDEDIHFVGTVAKIASLALNGHDLSKMAKFGLVAVG